MAMLIMNNRQSKDIIYFSVNNHLILLARIIICVYFGMIHFSGSAPHTQDYCPANHFNVSCPKHHVIMMHSAKYGRMNSGKCITTSHGYIGCSKNVIGFMHRKCSGRPKCLVFVPDKELHKTTPCPKDFASYLEASFECIKIVFVSSSTCYSSNQVVLNDGEGYITTNTDLAGTAGTQDCPWRIEAGIGLKIKLTLYNFDVSNSGENGGVMPSINLNQRCIQVGVVHESSTETSITTCGNKQRENEVYQSSSNVILLEIMHKKLNSGTGPFLIKYEVIGCKPLKLPPTVTFKRYGDDITVHCNYTQESWSLTCQDNKWIGELGECIKKQDDWSIDKMFQEEPGFPYGILLLVAIGVGLGVFFGGLLLSLAIYYIKKKHIKKQQQMMRDEEYIDATCGHSKNLHMTEDALTLSHQKREQYICDPGREMFMPVDYTKTTSLSSPTKIFDNLHSPYHTRPCHISLDHKGIHIPTHQYESPQCS